MTQSINHTGKGAFLVARSLFESKIWIMPPYYLKVWLWVLGKCNHETITRHGMTFNRGECLVTVEETRKQCEYKVGFRQSSPSKDQIWRVYVWLREEKMIETKKTTRGMFIKVLRYDEYQTIGNYKKRGKKQITRDAHECGYENVMKGVNECDIEDDEKGLYEAKKGEISDNECDNEHSSAATRMQLHCDTKNKNEEELKNEEVFLSQKKSATINEDKTALRHARRLSSIQCRHNPAFADRYQFTDEIGLKIVRWAKDFLLMRERDKVTAEQIDFVLEFLDSEHKDAQFWRPNIMSGKKFREQYLQIVGKISSAAKKHDQSASIIIS